MLARITAGVAVVAVLATAAWFATADGARPVATAELSAGFAALRGEIDELVVATDEARETSELAVLDDAIVQVTEVRERLSALLDRLDDPHLRTLHDELDEDLGGLFEAARAYAAGEAGSGAGARAYTAVSEALEPLSLAALRAVDARAAAAQRHARVAGWLIGLSAALVLAAVGIAELQALWRREQYESALSVHDLAQGLPVAFFRADGSGRLTYVSERARSIARALPRLEAEQPLATALGQDGLELLPLGGELVGARIESAGPGGRRHHFLLIGRLHEESEALSEGVIVDAAAGTVAEESLRESVEQFRAVVDHTQNGLALISHSGAVTLHNQAFARLLGYDGDELSRMVVGDLVPTEHVDQVLAILAACMWSSLAPTSHELIFVRRDGEEIEVEVTMTSFGAHGESASVLCEVRDTTEQRQAASALRRMADFDSLTGLPNRDLFTRRLEDAITSARDQGARVSVLLVDLDRFKGVNDTLGHASGDRLLRELGQRLAGRLPPGHTVARYGGDEFLVLAPWVQSRGQTEHLARRLLEDLREPVRHDGHELHLHASIGVATSPDHAAGAEDLLRCAVAAMYQAKRAGGSGYAIFDSEADEATRSRGVLEADLGGAFEQDQFRVHYQPLVDLSSGTVVAVEALARWEHPTRGLMEPNDFIPLLEESGEIGRLGSFVMRQAIADRRAWCEAGASEVRLAVNLSARQFHDPSLIECVESALREGEVEADVIEVEVTETTATLNEAKALEVARKLREIGVRIAIDDFGTGHSSLQRLRDFPVQTLKIDRSFVTALGLDPGSLTIVKGVVALGRALGLTVIAEGIEQELQAHILRGLGCDLGQGFLYAPALPADAVRDFLLRHGSGGERVVA